MKQIVIKRIIKFSKVLNKNLKKHYSDKIITFKGNATKSWGFMKELIGKPCTSKPCLYVVSEAKIISEARIANKFNPVYRGMFLSDHSAPTPWVNPGRTMLLT